MDGEGAEKSRETESIATTDLTVCGETDAVTCSRGKAATARRLPAPASLKSAGWPSRRPGPSCPLACARSASTSAAIIE